MADSIVDTTDTLHDCVRKLLAYTGSLEHRNTELEYINSRLRHEMAYLEKWGVCNPVPDHRNDIPGREDDG